MKEWLLKTEIFTSLDDNSLDLICANSDFVTYNSGDTIFKAGDKHGILYIVVAGSVNIIKISSHESASTIAELAPGDTIGELEFFTGSDFSDTGVASGETTLLKIPSNGESFKTVLDSYPETAATIIYEFLKVVSRKIRNANSLVRESSALIQELKRQVYGDKLTGLYNKTYLEETLPQFMQNRSEPVALILMKADNFKFINDTFGHEAGDDILKIMAVGLSQFIGEKGTVIRYFGNELGVILPGYNRDNSYQEAKSILAMLNNLDISEATKTDDVKLSMSLGIAVYPYHADISDELILKAHELPLIGRARGGNIILFPEDVTAQ
ncbi:MAG: GGDEF domain-containing protein [Leptospirales bacterium]|nr:GGDEF domain-containing protein [Leptospirales bacterium]